MGAPWGFAVQNGVGHCCTLTTKDVVLPWITAVVGSGRLATMSQPVGSRPQASPANPTVRFLCSPDGVVDNQGDPVCSIASASILPLTTGGPDAGWLPDSVTANAWLNWVSAPGAN